MKKIFALSLFCILLMVSACADELPAEAIVMEGNKYPLSCVMLGDGRLVVSGFEGSSADQSVNDCLIEAMQPYPAADRATQPLAGFIAMYDVDGTQRWSHRLPYCDVYQTIYPRVLPDGRILCLVQPYERMMGSRPETTTDVFILDAYGNPAARPEWLDDSFIQKTLPWGAYLANDFIAKSVPPADFPAPYIPTLTLYDSDMRIKWQVTPVGLEHFFTQQLYETGDGYVGYAVNLYDMEDKLLGNAYSCIYKLNESGGLVWKYPLKKGAWIYSLVQTAEGGAVAWGSVETTSLDEEPVSFFLRLDENGMEQRYRSDYYERYHIMHFSQAVSSPDGCFYVRGVRGWKTEDGGHSGYSVLIRMDSQGEQLQYFRIPETGMQAEFLNTLQTDAMGNAYFVGTCPDQDNLDRWYILPITASLFTDAW